MIQDLCKCLTYEGLLLAQDSCQSGMDYTLDQRSSFIQDGFFGSNAIPLAFPFITLTLSWQVSGSIQGAAEALTDSKAPGPLQRMGSLFSRVSMSLQRSQSGQEREDESARWPISDSIPVHFFSCPGADDYKVRGPTYLTDRKKVKLARGMMTKSIVRPSLQEAYAQAPPDVEISLSLSTESFVVILHR